ncbi:aryl hydrocarbon receptor nuclear translocator-like protein 2 isoform X1 [Peromyscus leucopus]|uniref:aryl hydrocarbon receptor nuclear translocator-like protein 2 isoform X1 n=2 Tax=Peromyscus leucopus TaxID=10041 RepID=UPI0010A0D6AB|nr:aryl hydrocarbon receptor nuclear translocator-like protein 2 isoform X1 [Peromyscus leucopus]
MAAARAEVPGRGLIESQSLALTVSGHMSPGTKLAAPGPVNSLVMEFPRKRKGNDSEPAQEAHSQMEKRRRDKMNHLIQELSSMIPPLSPATPKLDKLSVLRRAVQYLRSLRGMTESFLEENSRPSFIHDKELSHLILKTAEGFLFVVGCEQGRILFVSKSISKTLQYDQGSLMGQNLFDFLHPKDVAKVKEQLSCDVFPREKSLDTKTPLQVYGHGHTGRPHMHSGSRRSFFFRMKSCKIPVKEELRCSPCSKKKDHKKFYTVHCTGYLRSWPPNVVGMEKERDNEKDSGPLTCLVALGQLHPYSVPQKSGKIRLRPTEFVTRFAMNGKFVYVDQRATAILGYLPQELLGTSCYEYFHQDDHSNLTDKHKAVLQSKEKILTDSYKFRVKDGSFVTLRSQWFSFTNPWTKELEYIVSVNTLVLGRSETGDPSILHCGSKSSEDSFRQPCVSVPGVTTGTVLDAGSIGTEIANEVLSLRRLHSSSPEDSNPSEVVRDSHGINCRNASVPVSEVSTKECFSPSPETGGLEAARQHGTFEAAHSHGPLLSDGTQLDFDALCDNDDSAMAAFMNYLEAEAGLGDPGAFSDIQWTL